ncbi:MAG: transporter substrate-binding domain-containing protein [Desulfohalobiaceae bacterium]
MKGWMAFFSAVLVIIGLAGGARADTLRIATEGAYPPFNSLNDQGELEGFDVDIAAALCQAMGRECELVAVEWEEIINGLVQGSYDMIVASMARTPERDKLVDFTNHYYRSRSAFVAVAGAQFDITPEGLRGKVLCAPVKTVQADYLQRSYGDLATVKLSSDTEEAFDLLVAGDVHVVLSDSLNCLEFLTSEKGQGFDFIGEALPAEDHSSSAHIAVREGDDALRTEINQALQTIRLDGTYDRINRRYFPFSIY